jgi:hypothetical protein
MKNKLAILSTIVTTVLLLVITPACAKAVFEYSNLSVSAQEVESGRSVTVSLDITNTGQAEGICPVLLKIDGVQVDEQKITVAPGNTQSASFQVTGKESGSHTIDVNGLTTTFKVLKAADFKVQALAVSPTEVLRGSVATITADVTNIGEVDGDYKVVLRVNGEEVNSMKVTVAPGATKTVSFWVTRNDAGTCNISVGELTKILTVIPKPANLSLGGFKLTPTQMAPGANATITVDVTNTGDVAGDYEVVLKVNGENVQSKKVTVAPGATVTVDFTLREDKAGKYDISIGGSSKTLTVSEGAVPTLYTGDEWVYRLVQNGTTSKMTHTVTGEEKIGAIDCYAMKITFDPYWSGWVPEKKEWWRKDDLDRQKCQFSGSLKGVTIDRTLSYFRTNIFFYEDISKIKPIWPRTVGSEWFQVERITTVDVASGQTTTDNKTSVLARKVESVETVTVPAGQFQCYKIVTYEGLVTTSSTDVAQIVLNILATGVRKGRILEEIWYSDKAKAIVKYKAYAPSESWELLSYSVK